MRQLLLIAFLSTALSLSATTTVHADGIGAKVGTLGLGGEMLWQPRWLPLFDLRAGLNRFALSSSLEVEDNDYDADATLSNVFLTGNVNLPALPLRLTGGIYANSNRLELSSRPSGSYRIAGNTYPAALVGTLHGRVGFASTAGYLGAGLDFRAVRVGLSLDAGVLLQGSPRVDLSATGPLAGQPLFEQELERERERIEEDLRRYRYYPVVSTTLYWRF